MPVPCRHPCQSKFILLSGGLQRVPVVGAAQKDGGRKLTGLLLSQKMRVRFALVLPRTGAGGVVFGIGHGGDRMRFARMPLAPAGRVDVAVQLRVESYNRGIRTPRPGSTTALPAAQLSIACWMLSVSNLRSSSSEITPRLAAILDPVLCTRLEYPIR